MCEQCLIREFLEHGTLVFMSPINVLKDNKLKIICYASTFKSILGQFPETLIKVIAMHHL